MRRVGGSDQGLRGDVTPVKAFTLGGVAKDGGLRAGLVDDAKADRHES
jgi:hypothetical protein